MKILFGVLMISLLSLGISCSRDNDDGVMERQEDGMERTGDRIDEGLDDAGRSIEDGTEELTED